MSIRIPSGLPAGEILKREGFTVLNDLVNPLEIAILNLMPVKQETELQLLRAIGNTSLNLNITFLRMASHISKNTGAEHLAAFYNVHEEVKHKRFDGLIITGAPIETIAFEEVGYWKELCEIMAWSLDSARSVLHICWGAQAALYYHYGISKYPLAKKMFGIFPHTKTKESVKYDILKGFDDVFNVPQSRHTEIRKADIDKSTNLVVLSESEQAGLYMAASADGRRQIFVTGHLEYDSLTLKKEYERDIARGDTIDIPQNYFPGDDASKPPTVTWRAHANLFFSNWLKYCVQAGDDANFN